MKTLLVFGAAGQVGTELGRAALPEGWRVLRLERSRADITRPEEVARALSGPDPVAVVNAAAYTAVDRAEAEPEAAAAVNRDGVGHLARACAERGVPLIHLSTDYVFDGRKAGAYVEADPVAPLGVYGATKAAGEAAVRAAGPRHVILRTSWVYAPHGHNFVRTMLRLGRERAELRVVDDQTGSPTSATDIAAAVVAVARRLDAGTADGFGTFHYCSAGTTSWFGFAEAVFAQAVRHGYRPPRLLPIATRDYPTAAARPANSALDCSRIERIYGIRRPDWRASLARCIDAIFAAGPAAEGGA